ncbi:hypothetical protein CRUP_012209 [Coryphaenoides rupestris]|nr:hypothetical protein CRUP_012209 [Coryphaenoides rupestris]
MTAATATPQLMRDRLVQAIDGQSNETRLGKLINDVRKKTKNEDLAKRAKKLLRTWQKLIEPGQTDGLSKGLAPTSGSSNGGASFSKADLSTPLPPTLPSGRPVPELKNRNDFNNSPKVDKPSNRKRRCEQQKDAAPSPAKMAKTLAFDKPQNTPPPPSKGTAVGSDMLTDDSDCCAHSLSTDKEPSQHADAERLNKIPVNTVRPHPSSLGYTWAPPSVSSLLKASLIQQHARLEQASSGGQCQPRSPRSSSHSPRTPRQEGGVGAVKQTAAKTKTRAAAAGGIPLSMEISGPGPSPPLPPPQPLNVCVQGSHTDDLRVTAAADSQDSWLSNTPGSQHNLSSTSTLQDVAVVEVGGLGVGGGPGRKKRKKYRPKDYVVNLDGQSPSHGTKPVRLKDRRLTFDPVTGQIKSCFSKEASQEAERGENRGSPGPELVHAEAPPLAPPPPMPPNPLQQTNWKELSRNDIIQSYLSQQSSVLTTLGAPRAPGAHFFMSEYLKQERRRQEEEGGHSREARQTYVVASEGSVTDLPGVSRDVTTEDLHRLHTKHWPGVNGCYDTKEHWYDWTECISLDPHGDESRLNILPYVCLD